MPNYYRNRLTLRGDSKITEEIFASISSKFDDGADRVIDFNKIIPRPEELNIESYSSPELFITVMLSQSRLTSVIGYGGYVKDCKRRIAEMDEKRREKGLEDAKKYLSNMAKYGFANWYGWSINKWGTKWNSINGYDEMKRTGNTIHFETANGYCKPVISELSKKYPDIEFDYIAADEDTGSNTIKGMFKNGVFDGVEEHRTPAAFDIAFELYPEYKENFLQLPDGTWEYHEKEDDK